MIMTFLGIFQHNLSKFVAAGFTGSGLQNSPINGGSNRPRASETAIYNV